mgnify:CR=1 FL=1
MGMKEQKKNLFVQNKLFVHLIIVCVCIFTSENFFQNFGSQIEPRNFSGNENNLKIFLKINNM